MAPHLENLAVSNSHDVFHPGSLVWALPDASAKGIQKDTNKGKSYTRSEDCRKDGFWRRGVVESVSGDGNDPVAVLVKFENGEISMVKAAECFLQNDRDDNVDDLVRSDFLHEPGILHTLRVRYEMDSIYTYSGQILIAVNPHKELSHLYGERMMVQYKDVGLGELSPHTYAIAEAAYSAMMMDEKRQAIMISGESGAGKTESAKMVMQYLAHRAGGPVVLNGASNVSAPIEQQVLESNPLLEAFGNAKTLRNDNSSRFGKFVEIDFDPTGRVIGATISTYLLERSRVVSIASGERSFHIFYQMCAGVDADLRKALFLPETAADFAYLRQSETMTLENMDDANEFAKTLHAMHIIGLSIDQIESVLKCTAAVLHLGNINFKVADEAVADEAVIAGDGTSSESLAAAAALLGVPIESLRSVLMSRELKSGSETIVKRYTVKDSAESRDSLAKAIYSRVFDWLVAAVNRKIGAVGGSGRTPRTIGILDIYGFESFDNNSFEQLCINLANEKLQQAFNAHVFKAEQEEYASEGIDWSYVEFVDNQDVLDLLEGTRKSLITVQNMKNGKNLGIFSMIDEACRLPRATHEDLAVSLRNTFEDHPRFSAPKRDQYSFIISHYAGEVRYATEALLEKNRDFVIENQQSLMRQGSQPLPRQLFSQEDDQGNQRSSFKLRTIGTRFKSQLNDLANTLFECQPHFIRCIKPNKNSQPGDLMPCYVMEQLRAGGVLEAVRIACAGFPTRKPFMPFLSRYSMLLSPAVLNKIKVNLSDKGFIEWTSLSTEQMSALATGILEHAGVTGWQVGRSRVFLRTGQLAVLEGRRGKAMASAVTRIQSAWRSYQSRKEFTQKIQAVLIVQSYWRAYQDSKITERRREEASAIKIQRYWRAYKCRQMYHQNRRNKSAIAIQSHWKGHSARVKFLERSQYAREQEQGRKELECKTEAATVIQSFWRMYTASQLVQQRRKSSLMRIALLEQINQLELELRKEEHEHAATRMELQSKLIQIEDLTADLIEKKLEIEALRSTIAARDAHSKTADGTSQRVLEMEKAHRITIDSLKREIESLKESSESRIEVLQNHVARTEDTMSILRQQLVGSRSSLALSESENKDLRAELDSLHPQLHALKDMSNEYSRISIEEMESTISDRIAPLQKQLETSIAEVAARDAKLKDLAIKESLMIARIESLSSRIEINEKEKMEMSRRQAALTEEINLLRQPQKGTPVPNTCQTLIGIQDLVSPNSLATDMSREKQNYLNDPNRREAVCLLTSNIIRHRVDDVSVGHSFPLKPLLIPYSGWLSEECILGWSRVWSGADLIVAARAIITEAVSEAKKSFKSSIYWLRATLLCGGLLKTKAVGTPNQKLLFGVANEFIGCTNIHTVVGAFISSQIPLDINLLLSEEAKQSARRMQNTANKQASATWESRLDAMSKSKDHWRKIIGSIENISLLLQENSTPVPAVRALVWASLRYIDGRLLNELLMRRPCCSVSSAKALLTGISAIKEYIMVQRIDEDDEPVLNKEYLTAAFSRTEQACHFLIDGYQDCVRRARSGIDIFGERASIYDSLSLNQLYTLAKHQHDDWNATFDNSIDRKVLLEAINRLVQRPENARTFTPLSMKKHVTTEPWVKFDEDNIMDANDDFEDITETELGVEILVTPESAFKLYENSNFTKREIISAARSFITNNKAIKSPISPGPALPDGTQPSCSPGETLKSGQMQAAGTSMLSQIEKECAKVSIPVLISEHAEFSFLIKP